LNRLSSAVVGVSVIFFVPAVAAENVIQLWAVAPFKTAYYLAPQSEAMPKLVA
jgi:hypothetical protein